MKNIRIIFLTFLCCFAAAGDGTARTYYLPDYQSEFLYGNRVNDANSGHTSKPSCSDYGYYAAAERPTELICTRVNAPAPDLECYSCDCPSDYHYDDDNCSGNYVLSGSRCNGKYSKCICNPVLFPSSSSDAGCPAGQKPDTSSSCTNKSDNTTVYKCVEDPCYGIMLKNACETQGGYCVPSSDCVAGCEQCLDRCEGYKRYEGALDNCDDGCAPGKEISGCPGLCEAGGCKTCTPCAAEYNLTSCPDEAICSPCTDCDNTVLFQITGCAAGYADANTYWCTVPKTTQCVTLGFILNKSCDPALGQITVHCPFNKAYTACL